MAQSLSPERALNGAQHAHRRSLFACMGCKLYLKLNVLSARVIHSSSRYRMGGAFECSRRTFNENELKRRPPRLSHAIAHNDTLVRMSFSQVSSFGHKENSHHERSRLLNLFNCPPACICRTRAVNRLSVHDAAVRRDLAVAFSKKRTRQLCGSDSGVPFSLNGDHGDSTILPA
ncbi:hypothetical protein BDW22DRAFT_1265668 [Trametopsis cervina]|nr:hypothetical protein BDW22DRAFT_1265668 [Trametopsis cervina]